MEIKKFENQEVFWAFAHAAMRTHKAFEEDLMRQHQHEKAFKLDGYCLLCEKDTRFLVDRHWAVRETPGEWMPNWRERMVCPGCKLNNRQRAILYVIKGAVAARGPRPDTPLSLYAMEQITPMFRWLEEHLSHVSCTGREYMGEDLPSGTIVDGPMPGIRHENAEALSFSDQRFDFISSNDVLEHVNQPARVLSEAYRVLKPDGDVFITIPFHFTEKTVRRAELIDGTLRHLLPPEYHGNPLSEQGSLVFHDYGWDFLDLMRAAGFQDVSFCTYWTDRYGHLGPMQCYFYGKK